MLNVYLTPLLTGHSALKDNFQLFGRLHIQYITQVSSLVICILEQQHGKACSNATFMVCK